jgi:hypothetical protein
MTRFAPFELDSGRHTLSREGVALHVEPKVLSVLVGEKAKALERIDRAYAIDPGDVCTLYNSACVFALDGAADRALDALEAAVRRGYSYREWLEHDADLAHLQAQPRFQALLESMPRVG